MKNFVTLILFMLTASVFAQQKFQLGYYTTISGQTVKGEISEVEAINSTKSIKFRKKNKNVLLVGTDSVINVKSGASFFSKKQFQIDPSPNFDIESMSTDSSFKLEERTSFLKLLVEGNYKLYKYTENGNTYFFYEDALGEIITLKYKKHINNRNEISENKAFIQQLESLADINILDRSAVSKLKYTETDLIKYFISINGDSYKYKSKSKVKFNFFVGYSNHSMDIDFVTDLAAQQYSHLMIMPEIEYILDVNNKNQTSFYFNLRLHNFKKDFVEFYERENWHHKVDYASLVASLGVKQYFLSSNKFKFYAKAGVALNNPIKSNVQSPPVTWAVKTLVIEGFGSGVNTGVGVKIIDKVVVELDYDLMFNVAHIRKNTSLNFKVGYSF